MLFCCKFFVRLTRILCSTWFTSNNLVVLLQQSFVHCPVFFWIACLSNSTVSLFLSLFLSLLLPSIFLSSLWRFLRNVPHSQWTLSRWVHLEFFHFITYYHITSYIFPIPSECKRSTRSLLILSHLTLLCQYSNEQALPCLFLWCITLQFPSLFRIERNTFCRRVV